METTTQKKCPRPYCEPWHEHKRAHVRRLGERAVRGGMAPDFARYLVREVCERIDDGRSVDGDAYRALCAVADGVE